MINAVQPSFGENRLGGVRDIIKDVELKKEHIVEGTVGASGAFVLTKGSKYLTALNSLNKKAKPIVNQATNAINRVPVNSAGMKKFFNATFEGLKNIKFLKPLVSIAKTKPAKMIFGAFSGVSAVAVFLTESSNIVNTGTKIFKDTGLNSLG